MIGNETNERRLIKNVTPYEIISLMNKNKNNRQRILKKLEQININISELMNLPLKDLMFKVQDIMRNTYSIKYLCMNRNEMGIISRRINPLQQSSFKIHQNMEQNYTIHNYFYPRPLKVGKKMHQQAKINIVNLERCITKQLDENRKISQKNSKINEQSRTKIHGSWVNISKCNNGSISRRSHQQSKFNAKELSQNIEAKINPTKSYSRFLNKGILIVRG